MITEFAKKLFSGTHFTEGWSSFTALMMDSFLIDMIYTDDLSSIPSPGLCARCTAHTRTAVHIRGGFKGQEIVSERNLVNQSNFVQLNLHRLLNMIRMRWPSLKKQVRFLMLIMYFSTFPIGVAFLSPYEWM
jgi:hypothetical protein